MMQRLMVLACVFGRVTAVALEFDIHATACDSGHIDSRDARWVLKRNVNMTACGDQLGIEATVWNEPGPRLWLQQNLLDVLEIDHGLSVDAWFESALANDQWRPILTLGDLSHADPNGLSMCTRQGSHLIIAARGSRLSVWYRTDEAPPLEPCQRILLDIEPDQLQHGVVTLGEEQQQVYINGQAILSPPLARPFRGNVRHWPRPVQLWLLDNAGMGVWQGTLYRVALADDSLTRDEVLENLRQGLPSTLPTALDVTVKINEDAEETPGSHDAAWYRQSSPIDDATRVTLPVDWIDERVHQLQVTILAVEPLDPYFVYVTGLPDAGCLYRFDETRIGCGGSSNHTSLAPIDHRPPQVIYLPPLNQNSASGWEPRVIYCVSPVALFDPNQCVSIGTVTIVVDPVNDPPVAERVPPVRVPEGVEMLNTPLIRLTGTDVDEDDGVSRLQITQQPRYGRLILTIRSFRSDGLLHGLALSELDIVNGGDPVYVKYIYDPTTPLVVRDNATMDTFSFRVADQSGTWSVEESVEVTIVSALTAKAADAVVDEDSSVSMNLAWYGRDESGYQRDIGFLVAAAPAAEAGRLIDPETQRELKAGDLVQARDTYPYTNGTRLMFVPSVDFCTDPVANTGVELRFRTVAFPEDSNQSVISVSDLRVQTIRVRCLIDAISLTIPVAAYSLRALSPDNASVTPCLASELDPTGCNSAIALDKIMVETKDRHPRMATVTIWVDLGFLTFNPLFWNVTLVSKGRRSLANGEITFVANPAYLTNILSGLVYQSFVAGNEDIVVLVRYGNCSDFAPFHRLRQAVQTSHCQILRSTISITVTGNERRMYSSSLVSGFPWQIVFCLIVYPTVYYALAKVTDGCCSRRSSRDDGTVVPGDIQWIQYYNEESGDYYYENVVTGEVTWRAPVDEAFVPWSDNDTRSD